MSLKKSGPECIMCLRPPGISFQYPKVCKRHVINNPCFQFVFRCEHQQSLCRQPCRRHIQLWSGEKHPSVNVYSAVFNVIITSVLLQQLPSDLTAMIDPVTAIGLVSGILSFVGAAEKILKLSWTLYNSVEGCSEEAQIRLELADSMNSISNRIVSAHQPPLSEEDRALLTLAQECDKLTNDIKNLLQTVKPKRRKSKAQSSLAALKTLVHEPKIRDLEKQLQRCRDQLHFHIAVLSR